MFRNSVAEPPVEEAAPSSLVPLSILRLEMDPGGGDDWSAYLAERDVPVLTDAVGRDSVLSSDARQLLVEFRERMAAEREAAVCRHERLEREAEERDRERRAQIWQGAATALPDGVAPAAAMLQAAREDARPRRQSVLDHALSREEPTFHPIREEDPRWIVGGGDG
jgi:hypothetical protein